jgi:hypothetical protein
MSKNNSKQISVALATATCALLGGTAPSTAKAQEEPKWEFDTALLYYGEDNDRVQDASVSILATRNFVDDRSLTLGLSVDSLTGATPSGAIRQGSPQTFTRPSGNSAYTIGSNSLPLDDTFRDTRAAVNASWQQPLGRLYQWSVGASASKEYDYLHTGVNTSIARDFNQRNTTVSAGLAFSHDEFDAVGGIPTPLSSMLDVGDLSNRSGSDTKDVVDLVFGVSQVISRNLLTQLNYSYSNSSGYLNDPYKIISVVNGTTGDTVPRTPGPGANGPSNEYVFESRPDERTKHSLFGQAKYYMGGKVLDASYRYMTDDWEIDSHTVDVRYRWPFGDDKYLEPHLRFYTQSEAEFYQPSIVDGAPLPAYASFDYRLGNFDAITVGLKFGWKSRGGNDMSVRVELYQQRGDIPAGLLRGNQIGQVEYPDLDAIIVQFGYHFDR